ncbi:hypothetical protein [Devosia sp. 2618]|uniref:hypothetical protein n=1 Tax=Devosia sp. 2618 TaxID=3156454 RepID=UPI00339588BB
MIVIDEVPVMPRLLLAASLAVLVSTAAFADDGYIDDRSTATSTITSFYNAVARNELTRAWSYYQHEETDPAEITAKFEEFAKGYADTKTVTVLTGEEDSEGAAGSIYYKLPVAIDAVNEAGEHTQFAGCYTLKLVQPANQAAPPFRPLHIEEGHLEPAKGELSAILPLDCAD